MRLRHPPSAPRGRQWALAALGTVLPDWEPYLGLPAPVRELAERRDGHGSPVVQLNLPEEGAAALSA